MQCLPLIVSVKLKDVELVDQRAVQWAASIYTPTCQEGNAHSPTLGINHVLMFVSMTDKNQYLILIHICLVLNETVFFFLHIFLENDS